jgi:hypothetical protein
MAYRTSTGDRRSGHQTGLGRAGLLGSPAFPPYAWAPVEVAPRALYVTLNPKQKEKTFETEKTARERLPQENPRLFLAIGLAPELAPTVRGGSDRIKDTVGGQLAARSTNRRLIHRRTHASPPLSPRPRTTRKE